MGGGPTAGFAPMGFYGIATGSNIHTDRTKDIVPGHG